MARTTLLRPATLATAAVIAALLTPAHDAQAIEIPAINGHMTDQGKTLSTLDKNAVEDKLSKLQGDTRVDVAGWIVDAPQDQLDTLGHDAFQRWNIGRDWDNAIFFMIPKSGKMHLIQKDGHPELNPEEAARVTKADDPNASMSQRIDSIVEASGKIIRAKALQARPPGVTDPAKGLKYAGAFGLLLLFTIGLTIWKRPAKLGL